MLELAYPWMFVLLVLPVAIHYLIPAHREQRSALQVPFFDRLAIASGQQPRKGAVIVKRDLLQKLLISFSWLMLVTALARPQWLGEPIVQHKSARDLMVAVDLSGSMETKDFEDKRGVLQTRLQGVKNILADFAKSRDGDRLGLILFGTAPYLQVPFTDDLSVFLELLAESEIGMAGSRTNFGDAIGLSIKLFQRSNIDDRVLIVLTDGNDTGSKVPPLEAAKIARNHGIKIHTIAIGSALSDDQTALDLETLRAVAQINGGEHFQAANEIDLAKAHEHIAQLEPQKYETLHYSPKTPLFHYPLGLAVLVYLIRFSTLNWLALSSKKEVL